MPFRALDVLSQWVRRARTVAVDADDTLWYDARYFLHVRQKLISLVIEAGVDEAVAECRLVSSEQLASPGEAGWADAIMKTGILFGLEEVAMHELKTAVEEFRRHPVELLPDAATTIQRFTNSRRILLTKGKYDEQLAKLERSGLRDAFENVVIVSKKNADTFREVLCTHDVRAQDLLCVGNSIKHDVIPAVANGAMAVWLNHELNYTGRNGELPDGAIEVASWAEIAHYCTN